MDCKESTENNRDTNNQMKYDLYQLFGDRGNVYGKAKKLIWKLSDKKEFNKLENFLNLISYSALEKLFEYEGESILTSFIYSNDFQTLNFLTEKLPDIIEDFMFKDDFRIIMAYLDMIMSLIKRNNLKDYGKQNYYNVLEFFLKVDKKKRFTKFAFGDREYNERINESFPSIKEEIINILKNKETALENKD